MHCFSDQFGADQMSYKWHKDNVEIGERIEPVHFDFEFSTQAQQNASHQQSK